MIIKANETLLNAVLTPNSEDINYPVTNILDVRLSRLFKTDSSTTATIVFDAGAAVTVDSISIANHNISSGVTTLEFQGNATDSWGAPSVDETLTWTAGIITKSFTGGSYRYWRLNIVDAGNSDGLISLGRVSATDELTSPDLGVSISHSYQSDSVKSRTTSGNSYGDIRGKYAVISLQWNKITTATQKPLLVDFFDTVDIVKPFFITFDEGNIGLGTLYVTIDGDGLHFVYYDKPAYCRASLSMIEEI